MNPSSALSIVLLPAAVRPEQADGARRERRVHVTQRRLPPVLDADVFELDDGVIQNPIRDCAIMVPWCDAVMLELGDSARRLVTAGLARRARSARAMTAIALGVRAKHRRSPGAPVPLIDIRPGPKLSGDGQHR